MGLNKEQKKILDDFKDMRRDFNYTSDRSSSVLENINTSTNQHLKSVEMRKKTDIIIGAICLGAVSIMLLLALLI